MRLIRQQPCIDIERKKSAKKGEWKWKKWVLTSTKRKQAYCNALRTEPIADTFENWMNRDSVIFPIKFRIKDISTESNEETKIHFNIALQKSEAEINFLRLRVPKYQSKFDKVDKMYQGWGQLRENSSYSMENGRKDRDGQI